MRLALSLLISGSVLLATTSSRAQYAPARQVKDVAGDKPTIELVFVIDTTGSMGGLIEGANQTAPDIPNPGTKAVTCCCRWFGLTGSPRSESRPR